MEIKAITSRPEQIEGRTVTGLAAVFGNVDSGGDKLHEGAFRKTLKENSRRIRHLWQHDYNQPPTAAIKEIKEVGRSQIPAWVKEDYPEVTGGLLVTREYLETARGNEILEGLKSGAINEMSFGYDPVKFDYETMPDTKATIRNLREVKLFDTSDVVWGMNALTVAAKCDNPLKHLYSTVEMDEKGAGLLLQSAAGALLANPAIITDEITQSIKALLDLLTAEPQTSEQLAALTDELRARIALAERDLVF
jgi:HK97 family phage prohead protease